MRLARLAPVALAVLPAAAVSQVSADPLAVVPPGPGQPRGGQYRTALELIEFDVPGATEDSLRAMRDVVAEGLASGNAFCLEPDPLDEGMRRKMLEHIAEGECTFDSFNRTGAAVNATMSCIRSASVDSQVTMGGRIWAENADLDMTLKQDLPGLGATRIRVRAQSARVGDC